MRKPTALRHAADVTFHLKMAERAANSCALKANGQDAIGLAGFVAGQARAARKHSQRLERMVVS